MFPHFVAPLLRRRATALAMSTLPPNLLKLQYDRHGPPRDVLSLVPAGESPTAPPAGHTVVRWRLAALNWSDVNTVEGAYPGAPPPPATPGNEGVGIVLASTPDDGSSTSSSSASPLPSGARVVPVAPRAATWGAWSCVPTPSLYVVPEGVPDAAAATMSVNPPTAVGLLDAVPLSSGDTLIQNGATTAVGKLVLQLAAVRGLHTINIVRDREPGALAGVVAELRALGGGEDNVTVLTETQADGLSSRDAAAMGQGALLGLNCVGGKAAGAVIKLLSHGGTLVTYGGLARKPVTLGAGALIFKDVRATGFWLSSPSRAVRRRPDMDTVARLLQEGVIGTEIETVPLAEWRTALDRMEAGGAKKQVLELE